MRDNNMRELYRNTLERLNAKKKELFEKQEYFDVMWNGEKQSICFERNAINDLLVMQQLKFEIQELEYLKNYIRTRLHCEDNL